MKRKITVLTVSALLLALSVPVEAQQPNKVPRIGFITGSGEANDPGPNIEAFRQKLRELGYFEGKNILVEYRYIEGKLERVPGLVADLVELKVDVLVSGTLSVIRAAKQATKTIPIVMAINGDPVAVGLIDSLARPGGNVTGLTRLNRELSAKRLELLKEVVPRMSRVGVLVDANQTVSGGALEEYGAAARALKISIQFLKVRGPNPDLEGAVRDANKKRVNAMIATRAGLLFVHRKKLADLAIKYRLPLMSEGSDPVEAGALVSYSSSDIESYQRAAVYVDKILKGAKPADLPVEQPTKFEFVINLKTAKMIGVTIPPNVLARADKVIK
jgi:putative tryptophan/tyrosine transport system substrate-binding protein